MVSNHPEGRRKSKALSPERSDRDSDEATSRASAGGTLDLKLPWRVDEFENWDHKTNRPTYHLEDRRGLVIGVFFDLQTARALVEVMNGFAYIPARVR